MCQFLCYCECYYSGGRCTVWERVCCGEGDTLPGKWMGLQGRDMVRECVSQWWMCLSIDRRLHM